MAGVLALCVLALMALALRAEAAAVLGIDFGSTHIKVAVIQGGTREVVLNKEGLRRVKALTGINAAGERVFSQKALNLLKQSPALVQRYSKHLLGKTPDHPWIKRNAAFYTSPIAADSRGTAAHVLGNETIPTVQLVSWLLMEAKDAAKHHTKSSVVDAVISVPPFFTHWERLDILTAAHMAGLNVLSLMNEGTACATDYYLTRTIGNSTGNIVLFDMGDVATKVTLLQFNRELVEKTKKDVIEANVADVTWDDSLGGRNFDETLAQHLAVLATKQTGEDIARNPKAMEKLRAEAQRVKEVLSANTDIEARVEGILYDTYFSSKVTRAEFEKMNAPLFTELLEPVKALLAANDLTVHNITEVQVIGGGARIPKIRETLAAFFERPNVDLHLNGDDCVCMGCAFYAAMKSNAFKKQPFKFRDITLFPVSVSHPAIGDQPAGEARELFPFQNKLYSKKMLSFDTAQPVTTRLRYDVDAAQPRRLPPGTPRELLRVDVGAPQLAGYNVTADSTPRVHIAFRLTSSGTVTVEEVSAEFQAWEEVKPKTKKTTTRAATTAPADGDAASSDAPAETETPEPALPPVLVNKTINVGYRETQLGVRSFTTDELAAMQNHTHRLIEEETARVVRAETINDLEAFIFNTKERLSDDDMERHSTADEREKLVAQLNAAGEWMESGKMEEETTKVIRLRLSELREAFRVLEKRAKMFRELPDAFKSCRTFLRDTQVMLGNITELREVNETDVEHLAESVKTSLQWMTEKEKEFKAQAENVDPVVTPSDVGFRCDVVRTQARRLVLSPLKRKKDEVKNETAEETAAPKSEPEEKAEEEAEEQAQEEEVK